MGIIHDLTEQKAAENTLKHNAVELMQGNITFVSEENVGTVFMLVFSGQSAQKLR